jgi:hypothetical protein
MVDGFEVVETRMRGHPVFGKKVYTVAGSQDGSAVFHVACSRNDDDVRCSCRKMEREGLPCRHILRVMRHTDVSRMPDCCDACGGASRSRPRGSLRWRSWGVGCLTSRRRMHMSFSRSRRSWKTGWSRSMEQLDCLRRRSACNPPLRWRQHRLLVQHHD